MFNYRCYSQRCFDLLLFVHQIIQEKMVTQNRNIFPHCSTILVLYQVVLYQQCYIRFVHQIIQENMLTQNRNIFPYCNSNQCRVLYNSTYRSIFHETCQKKTKSDCIQHFPIDLEPNGHSHLVPNQLKNVIHNLIPPVD